MPPVQTSFTTPAVEKSDKGLAGKCPLLGQTGSLLALAHIFGSLHNAVQVFLILSVGQERATVDHEVLALQIHLEIFENLRRFSKASC